MLDFILIKSDSVKFLGKGNTFLHFQLITGFGSINPLFLWHLIEFQKIVYSLVIPSGLAAAAALHKNLFPFKTEGCV